MCNKLKKSVIVMGSDVAFVYFVGKVQLSTTMNSLF